VAVPSHQFSFLGVLISMNCPNAAYWIAAQAGVSTIAWGGVGVAKNALIEAVMSFLGYVGHVFIPSQHAPEDIGGVPYHDTTLDRVRMVMVEWIHDLQNPKRWLHIDEGTTAPNQMKPPLLSCLNERRVGSFPFHPTTIVTMAANPPELAPNGSAFEPALCNRLYHHDWQFPADLWHQGLRSGGKFPVPSHFPVVGDFSYLLPKYGGLVSLLCRNKPSLMNTDKIPDGALAFATPRSWWNLVKCLAAAEQCGYLDHCRADLGAGTVGVGASSELLALMDSRTMHNVAGICDGSEKVKVDTSTIDRLIGLPSALVLHLQSVKSEAGGVDPSHITNAVDVMLSLAENDLPDEATPSLGEIRRLFPEYEKQMPTRMAARWGRIVTAIYGGGR